jgi:hypothetical protein
MAKLDGVFKYDGTFQDVTSVNSRAYGAHIRKARKTFKLNDEMKLSSGVIQKANVYAKTFKDAIDPYRRDFRDGQLWQRLVSIFKKQLQKKGAADFSVLEGQDLNKIHPLGSILTASATVTQNENILDIHVTSRYTRNRFKDRADGYQQTLIVIFIDRELQTHSLSESASISFEADPGEQDMRCELPEGATTAIVALKCNFSFEGQPLDLQKGMGMKILKVVVDLIRT